MNESQVVDAEAPQLPLLGRDSIQARFEEFHRANPKVYEFIKRFALEAKRSGRRTFGMAAIIERARWELNLETEGDDYKVNNNHRSRYARKLMAEIPELAGFFRVRDLRTA